MSQGTDRKNEFINSFQLCWKLFNIRKRVILFKNTLSSVNSKLFYVKTLYSFLQRKIGTKILIVYFIFKNLFFFSFFSLLFFPSSFSSFFSPKLCVYKRFVFYLLPKVYKYRNSEILFKSIIYLTFCFQLFLNYLKKRESVHCGKFSHTEYNTLK